MLSQAVIFYIPRFFLLSALLIPALLYPLSSRLKGPPSKSELQKLEVEFSKKALKIVYWGNLHGLVGECHCSLAPYGGVKRRGRALLALESRGASPHLRLDFGNLLTPSSAEKILKKDLTTLLTEAELQSRDAVHINQADWALLNEHKLKAPRNAIHQNKLKASVPLELSSVRGYLPLIFASNPDFPLKPDQVKSEVLRRQSKERMVVPIILSTHPVDGLKDFSHQLDFPFLVLGANDRLDGTLCYSRKKGLFCYGGWDGKLINSVSILFSSKDSSENWISINELRAHTNNFERAAGNPELQKQQIAEFERSVGSLNNRLLYSFDSLVLTADKYGEN